MISSPNKTSTFSFIYQTVISILLNVLKECLDPILFVTIADQCLNLSLVLSKSDVLDAMQSTESLLLKLIRKTARIAELCCNSLLDQRKSSVVHANTLITSQIRNDIPHSKLSLTKQQALISFYTTKMLHSFYYPYFIFANI